VKILWTIFCIFVPTGGAIMLEFSRPPSAPRGVFADSMESPEVPPLPGSGLSALSALAICGSLLLGTAVLASSFGVKINGDVTQFGIAAVALLVMGVYGIARARVILERRATG